ncbi:uncharacterized protein BCR38DRAFT_42888 [Pseudomassariella vexata]|uniref:Uncharacterized protein n=1 Tax=Pseudomassariella vexata TaxID=1141098 RepID=A0A1Y2DN82_9PEZI|nr:uncharacterized protein BCR38DRAFT_42888 [Pseudomassariella vexata]ORY60614.1 hypothetical protein BCR38DRAFT_42888 [Pseudomassariella vexata]
MPLEVKNDEQNRPKEYVKHNSAFEPLITSIEVMKPTFDISSANLICSTGSLHRIYRYLEDSEDLDSDRLDMQWHSGTLFITRWADDPSRQTSAGYESGFERATCSFSGELQDHISHHRVLSYRLGGLHLVVRAESEAYFCECHKPSPGQTSTADSVAEGIGKLVVSNDGEATEQGLDGASSSLNVLKAGRDIPSSCLIMIRTGNQMYDRRPFEAQMYFSNRHRLYQISHTRGIFDPAGAKIEDVSDHLG